MRRWRFAAAFALIGTAAGLWVGPVGPTPGDRPITPFTDPDRPTRIVAFGTSLTARNAWPDVLEARLTACLDRPVTVIRVAAVGQDSAWGLGQTERVAAADPDIVLIEFAANDADLIEGVSPARARAQHAALLDALRAGLPEARLVLMTMNPVGGLQRLVRARLGAHHAMYRALARDEGVALADLTPRWQGAGVFPPDGLHPTDAATREVVVPALAGLIGQAAGHEC